jgi:hypothetical protein
MADAALHGWSVQTSRSTGRHYWFNSRTGQSSYEEPPELREARARGQSVPSLPLAGTAAAPPPQLQQRPTQPHPQQLLPPPPVPHAAALQPAQPPSALAAVGGAAAVADAGARMQTAAPPGLESENPVHFRAAVEELCRRLTDGAFGLVQRAGALHSTTTARTTVSPASASPYCRSPRP